PMFSAHPAARRCRRAAIEARAATEKFVRVQKTEDEVGVRHRRLAAAAAITGRTRLSTGAVRPYMQHAALVDTRDRPATRADASDIQALQRHALACNAPVGSDRRLAADNKGDICRGAPHVEGNEVAWAQ